MVFFKRFKSFWPYFAAYRRQLLIGTVALILTDLVGLAIPWLLKNVIDLLPDKPSNQVLISYAGALALAACFQGLFRFGWRKYFFEPARKIEFEILNRLFDRFLILDQPFFLSHKIGDLMSRATNDLRAARDFIGLGLLIAVDCLVVIVCSLTLMIVINPSLTLSCLLPLPLVPFLFYQFSASIGRQHKIVQEHLAQISSRVQENLAGIRALHAYVQEENEKRKFRELSREYLEKNMKLTRLFGVFSPLLIFIVGLSALISLWIGGKAVISEEMTLGAFVAFNGYLMMLSWPMMGMGYIFNLAQKGLSAMNRLDEVFASNPQLIESPPAQNEPPVEGAIEFRNLCFSYPEKSGFELKDINLKIEAGSQVAIIGMIGAGKTTLVQLIPRLYDPQSGGVWIGGKPTREIPLAALRESIGFVDQAPYLFSTSLRNNVVFGRERATEEEIETVIQIAGLAPDLSNFPQGLETEVGEKGVSLSGGQKQRVALARALLKKPKTLILDDSFSSLDVETEEKILQNMKQYLQGTTTLILTHRLSTVRHADRIFVLEKGQIIERGNHSDLMDHGGYYQKIYKSQELAQEMEIYLQ